MHPGIMYGIDRFSCRNLLLLLPTGYSISSFLQMLHPECKELPEPNLLPGQLSHGAVGVKEGRVQWISMAFESVSLGALCRVLILKTCPRPFLSLSPDQREIPRLWPKS